MGLPDFLNYYASHLTRIIDCHCHNNLKDWISESGLSPIPLQFSPLIPWSKYPLSLKTHPLIGVTLAVFHQVAKQNGISSTLSPRTPLRNNPDFTPGFGNHYLQFLHSDKPVLAGSCFYKELVKEISALKAYNKISQLPLWTYFQICSYITSRAPKCNFTTPLMELKLVCLQIGLEKVG